MEEMRRFIIVCTVLAVALGGVTFVRAAETASSSESLPGAGSAAEKEPTFCAFEKKDGTFFCIKGSENDEKCTGNYLSDLTIARSLGFTYARKQFSDCSFVFGPSKFYVEPDRITLCHYINPIYPTQISCLPTFDSIGAAPGDCPTVCQQYDLTCGTTKKKYIGECEYVGPPPQDIGKSISQLYTWSLRVLGLVVFIMFVYAGLLRFFGGVSPGNIQKSKDIMTSAVYGAILLLAAVIILNAINPDLTTSNFSLPQVNQAPSSNIGGSSGGGSSGFQPGGSENGSGGAGASGDWVGGVGGTQ